MIGLLQKDISEKELYVRSFVNNKNVAKKNLIEIVNQVPK